MAMGDGHGPGLTTRMLAQPVGAPTDTLVNSNLASHSHEFMASSEAGTSASPSGSTLGTYPVGTLVYGTGSAAGPHMNSQVVGTTGANQPVDIHQPELGVLYCIALVGLYPSRP
mgnify:FL=1